MADSILSGYKDTPQTALSTELNSLVDNGFSALSGEIDNSTNKYMLADIEVSLASFTAGTTGDEAIELYLVPSQNGTTFPDWATGSADAQENNLYFVVSVPIAQGDGAKLGVLRYVALPNGKWKLGVRNRSNGTLAAGSTVTWRPHQYASV